MVSLIKAALGNINTRHGENAGRGFPHVGIDIGWGGGLDLYAPAAGWLSWDWVGTYGRRAIIRHDDGTWSLLAHAEAWFVDDARVEQGQHIGLMGRTGGPWGTAGWFVHCHQEYHLANGTAVDPLAYMGAPAGLPATPIPPPEHREDDTEMPIIALENERGKPELGWITFTAEVGKIACHPYIKDKASKDNAVSHMGLYATQQKGIRPMSDYDFIAYLVGLGFADVPRMENPTDNPGAGRMRAWLPQPGQIVERTPTGTIRY